MAQKAPVRVCLLIPLLVHGVCGTTAAAEVNFQQDDTVLLQLGTDATSFDLARVSSRKGVPTVTSMVLHVNASQQKGQRQVEAADHMVNGASWSQLGQDIDGEAPGDQSGKSVSLSSDGSRVAIGAINNGGAGYSSGHVRVFGLSGNTWSQLGQDIDGEASYDYSGWSVSLSSDGSRVAIGASYNGGAGALKRRCWVRVRSRSRLRAFGQHMEPVGAGHRWRSLLRLQWRVGVAEQRRQPRGHWSDRQRRCWVQVRSRSRFRAFGQHMEPVGAGHRWRSLLRLQWLVGVAEQRRQPRGHRSVLQRRCWVQVRSRSRLRAFGQHMEPVGAGHRWRSPRRSEWRVGVAEQRRQPRGHRSDLQRRCWAKFRSRSRLRAFGQHMEPVGAGHRWRSLLRLQWHGVAEQRRQPRGHRSDLQRRCWVKIRSRSHLWDRGTDAGAFASAGCSDCCCSRGSPLGKYLRGAF
ncbi:unnamed protein product [Prorocentrum cordatum]|uniref:Subtilisin n=1 Tax=Prorocentrum cordatum TaxID=2364126 RepID=A0ABN9R611_9DINO|nr:unnamed protein product [Polarella glacialis]